MTRVAAHLPQWAVAPLGEAHGLKLFLDGTSVINPAKEDLCASYFAKVGGAPKTEKELQKIAEKEEREKAKAAEKEANRANDGEPAPKKAKSQVVTTKKRVDPLVTITHMLEHKPIHVEVGFKDEACVCVFFSVSSVINVVLTLS